MVKELMLPKLRYNVTGIRRADIGDSRAECHEYSERRQKILGNFLEHTPTIEKLGRMHKRYRHCRGAENCGLHHICEHCWFNRISMPVVHSLCGGPDSYRPTRSKDNLYIVTFSNIKLSSVRDLNDAANRINHGRSMFHHLTSRPVFRKGGIISGGMAYWYPWRVPFHSKLDEKLDRHRMAVSGKYACDPGWGFKVTMLVRTTFRVPNWELRRYILNAMNWVRQFTPEDEKAAKKDYQLYTLMNSQASGVFTPPDDPGKGRYLVRVRRCRTNSEAIVRYSVGGRVHNAPSVKSTRTSFGTKLVRDLRLPLLECDPQEGAWMLACLGLPNKGDRNVKHVIQFGDFFREERPQTTWMKFAGPLRDPGFVQSTYQYCGLDRPPETEAENNRFRRALNKLPKDKLDLLLYAFLKRATCSEYAGE